MAVRKCPYCLAVVPATQVVAHSNDLTCPGCGRPLEVSPISTHVSVAAGLAGAVIVWHFSAGSEGMLGWVLPIVYSFFAFSIISPLILMLAGDLRLKSVEAFPAATAPSAATSEGSHH
jgi:hypothetical protein